MPQRLAKPIIRHVTSPVTMRSIALFVSILFITYVVVNDQLQRASRAEREATIDRNVQETRATLEVAKEQNQQFEQALATTRDMLGYLNEITHGMRTSTAKTVTDERTSKKKRRVTVSPICYELRPTTQMIGNNAVVTNEYKRVKCAP